MKIGKKKWGLSLLAVISLVLLCAPSVTHAASSPSFWDLITGGGGISGFFAALLYPLVEILARLLALVGNLVNYAIQPGDTPITSSPFVTTGWTAMRDITNMVFILILLGIALDYILFNSVGVKRALPRLLLIALLINFSLPIAGVVLDFANVFTVFFLDHAVGGVGTGQLKFSEALANQLHLSSLFTNNSDQAAGVISVNTIMDGTFSNTIFIIIMLLGTLFVFLALGIMFFIRYFFISILLIVLPLALVASVIPPLSSHFGKWTRKFIQWTMFAPAAAFFLYLTMVFLGSQQMQTINNLTSSWTITGIGTQISTYIFAWMLTLMSLTTAQSMGITGATTAVTMFNKGSRWARGKAWGGTTRTAAALGRKIEADKQMEKLGTSIQKAVPGWLGGGLLASGARGVASKAKGAIEKREAPTAAEKAKWEGLSDAGLAQEQATWETSVLPGAGAKVAFIAAMRAKKGKLKIMDPKTGIVNEKETKDLVINSYKMAKMHRNTDAMKAIRKAHPTIWHDTIAPEEWEDLEKKGKLVQGSVKRDPETNKIIAGKHRDTGETFEQAQNKVFDEISSADFENLKGMWGLGSVTAFLKSSLTSGDLRAANNAGDGEFLQLTQNALDNISKDEAQREHLVRTRKTFLNYLKTGGLRDFGLKLPPEIEADLAKKEEEKKVSTEEQKSPFVDQFGRPLTK